MCAGWRDAKIALFVKELCAAFSVIGPDLIAALVLASVMQVFGIVMTL